MLSRLDMPHDSFIIQFPHEMAFQKGYSYKEKQQKSECECVPVLYLYGKCCLTSSLSCRYHHHLQSTH